MINKMFYLLAAFIVLLSSCSDDDKEIIPDDADDNFITSVVMTAGTESYTAAINNNEITVTVPYTVSLDNAKAVFTYTPSATIMPDPEKITDWDTERTFRVTSYNKEANEYTYKVVKDEIRHEGNAELKTAAEVAAFVASGVTIVKGDLIIGSDADGAEALTDISTLDLLKEVQGNIIIRNSYNGVDLTGLDNITTAGGLQIGTAEVNSTAPELIMMTMKSLATVTGDIVIKNNNITYVLFENLAKAEGNILFNSSALQTFEFPKLAEVAGDFVITAIDDEEKSAGDITALTLPELTTVGGKLSAIGFARLLNMSFPKLNTAGSIDLYPAPVLLETLEFPEITVVNGDFTIHSGLIDGDFLPTGNIRMSRLTGLGKLTTVKGVFKMQGFQVLEELPNLGSLTTAGGIFLSELYKCYGQELDLSRVSFETFNDVNPSIVVEAFTYLSKIITQDDMSHVDIRITDTAPNGYDRLLPQTNFTSARNLNITAGGPTDPVLTFERVTGNLIIERGTMRKGFSAPNLTAVDGYLSVTALMSTNIEFPKLETVGGQLLVNGSVSGGYDFSKLKQVCCAQNPAYAKEGESNNIIVGSLDVPLTNKDLEFPELERVAGTGITLRNLKSVTCPKLTTIDGRLTITAGTQMTAIGMSALTKLTDVHLNNLRVFTDFSMFAPFIKDGSITVGKWTITNCGYNPTYQDMVDGKYTAQ